MPGTMVGQRVLVTGATAGIGQWAAIGLAKLGARVVIVGRDPARTTSARDFIVGHSGNLEVDSMVADLSSQSAVRQLASDFIAQHGELNVLVNNAGAINLKRELTVDGYERTFATNHLAPFLLTHLLMPALKRTRGARVVNVASNAHRYGPLDFDDLMSERNYRAWVTYGRSKLANILFTRELARRIKGYGITANSLHPGVVGTNFMDKPGPMRLLWPIARLVLLSSEQGSRTTVYLASSPEVKDMSGLYFSRCKPKRPRRFAEDDEAARRLWNVSEKLVGLTPQEKLP